MPAAPNLSHAPVGAPSTSPSSSAPARPSWIRQPAPSAPPSSSFSSPPSTSSRSSSLSSPRPHPRPRPHPTKLPRPAPPPNISGPSSLSRTGAPLPKTDKRGNPLLAIGGVFPEREGRWKREDTDEGEEEEGEGSRATSRRPSSSETVVAEDDEDDDHTPGKQEKRRKGEQPHSNDPSKDGDADDADGKGEQVGGELKQDSSDWEAKFDDNDDDLPIRNGLGAVRYAVREGAAEFLGTLILMIVGLGGNCQATLSDSKVGNQATAYLCWGLGVMASIYVSGGVSGGHCNPVVTITLSIFRGFPVRLIPRYLLAQLLGAFLGALIIYGNYSVPIASYDSANASSATVTSHASATLFVTAPLEALGGTAIGFAQEVLASGTLMIAILALGDEGNAPPGAGLGAIVLGLVVTAICMSNGWISGFASNPARDLGPRLALAALGYGSKTLFTHNNLWWLSGAIAGPLVGSIAGAVLYDICVFTGAGSPLNSTLPELLRASGLPRAHTMVRKAVNPSYRSQRQRPEHYAESGLSRAGGDEEEGEEEEGAARRKGEKEGEVDELGVRRRLERGREKIERDEEGGGQSGSGKKGGNESKQGKKEGEGGEGGGGGGGSGQVGGAL